MKTFCKDCKFIKDPVETVDSVGKTWGPHTCEAPLNMTIVQDFLGNDKKVFAQSPYERNKEHNCHLYENALTGEINPSIDPIEVPPVIIVPVDTTKEDLAFIITQKKMNFGKEMITRYSSMNSLKEFNASQVVAAAQKFASIQALLLSGSIGTVYGIISAMIPDELVSQEEIDYFKLMIENFNTEIAPLVLRLDQMINPPVVIPPVVIPPVDPAPAPIGPTTPTTGV
jgi:hypothetical protein